MDLPPEPPGSDDPAGSKKSTQSSSQITKSSSSNSPIVTLETQFDSIAILLIENDWEEAERILQFKHSFTKRFYQFTYSSTLSAALSQISRHRFNLIVVNIDQADINGVEGLISLQQRIPAIPIVVLVNHHDVERIGMIVNYGVQDYLIKRQFDSYQFERAVEFALERQALHQTLFDKTLELERSEANLRNIFNTMQDAILILDQQGIVLFANRAAQQLFDFPASVMAGMHLGVEFSGIGLKEITIRQHIFEMSTIACEWLSDNAFIVSLRDISEQKKAVERERLIAELSGKNSELEKFSYMVSHDLKSPLTTIQGFIELIRSDIQHQRFDQLPEELTRINDAAESMKQMLDDILRLAKAGQAIDEPQQVSLRDIIGQALNNLTAAIQQAEAEIMIQSELPMVLVDKQRIVIVFQNLVENAIKFRKQNPPQIKISAFIDNDKVICSIQDNGKGIEPDALEKVFNLFHRLDTASEGSGVGLAIVKRIIDAHGGKVWVSSTESAGTTFYFSLQKAS